MGFLPFLAFAGLPETAIDHIDQVGWFLPFCILIIPVTLILFFVFSNTACLLLAVAQAAAIFYSLRALVSHLRRKHFTSYQVRLMLAPSYLVACFATNIAALIGVGLVRKFF